MRITKEHLVRRTHSGLCSSPQKVAPTYCA